MELQTTLQVAQPSGLADPHLMAILAIIVVTGLLGGLANAFLADRPRGAAPERGRYALLGVVAALTVPLFLNMISSNLLESARTRPLDLFVFAGFSVLYVVATRRFVENVTQRLFSQLEQMRSDVGALRDLNTAPPPQADKTPESAENDANSLSYQDVGILRAINEENFVYGNLAGLADKTGLPREQISGRLAALKALGLIEARINDKSVLHWFVSQRGKQVLDEVLGAQEERKSA
ncbi:YEATS-associated helix-containing protein [Oryzomicrobium sp.]|uniref:YEATS-associated helix-containing protein n=1 Tax=Oryzomicrobium sp. TaxID=1911578 RepID=UPI002FE31B14